jgi:hypothetical protein
MNEKVLNDFLLSLEVMNRKEVRIAGKVGGDGNAVGKVKMENYGKIRMVER